MRNCEWCGEYKKVRKFNTSSGRHWPILSYCAFPMPWIFAFDYVCKKCNDAAKLVSKDNDEKLMAEAKEKEEKEKKAWIKQRDELLEKDSIKSRGKGSPFCEMMQ